MFKRSPSRNQRSKGFKLKHGLQIFLLLAICVWLLYQVKHSHDKKIAFDKSSMELSEKLENEHEVIKLGRKDLHPRPEEKNSESEIQHKEEEIEGDEEENKPDEDEDEKNKHEAEEDESKPEENDEEGKESGDDELDEQDREKAEEEAEREGDFVDDEEKGKKEETDDGENEEKERQMESVGSSDDQDHDRNTQEAREENYKRDDASSAVVRSTQDLNNEAEDQNSGESIEKELARKNELELARKNELELDDKTNNTKEINSDQNNSEEKAVAVEEIEGNQNINVIASEEEDDGSQTNSMVAEDVVLPKASNILKLQSVHTLSSVAQNGTYMSSHSTRDLPNEMVTLKSNEGESKMQMAVHNQAENAGIAAKTENSNSDIGLSTTNENADVAHGEFSDASNNAETVVQEGQTEKSSLTTGEESSLSSTSDEIKYGAQSEKAETANGTFEGDNTEASSSTTENAHVIQSVTDNSPQPHEEVAQSNMGNLTETESKGMDNEDAALNDN